LHPDINVMNKPDKYFLKTNRLGFREWREDDISHAIGLWGDYEVTKYFDGRGKLSKDSIQERLSAEIKCHKEHGLQYWPIFLLKTNLHVGCCGLRPYDLPSKIYEIGFHIRSNLWKRGYGHESAAAIIKYAFNVLQAKALFAGHNPKNSGSRYILEQMGFHYTHDEYYPPTNLNHACYSLKANEYISHI
jgi:ribosomal-protein-alanine N-acetyltransferase